MPVNSRYDPSGKLTRGAQEHHRPEPLWRTGPAVPAPSQDFWVDSPPAWYSPDRPTCSPASTERRSLWLRKPSPPPSVAIPTRQLSWERKSITARNRSGEQVQRYPLRPRTSGSIHRPPGTRPTVRLAVQPLLSGGRCGCGSLRRHLPLRSQPASFLRRPCRYPLCRPTFLRGATIPASLLLRTFLRSFGRACLLQICHQCGLPCGGQFPPCYGLPRSGFLGDGWCRLPSFGPDPIPTSFDCADDCGSASFAQFSFRLRRFRLDQRWRLRFAPDLGPSALLGFLHPPSSRSGEFPALAGGRSRRG